MRADTLLARAREDFPAGVHTVLEHAVRRLTDYQDAAYAALYLERLAPFREAEPALLEAVTRHLAVRMSYEDAIRVAQAKTRPERLARIRAETGAAPGEPVAITEFLKPGLEEFCDILPAPLARTLLALGERWPWLGRARRGMTVRTSTVAGFLKLRMLVALRRTRRLSWRYRHEQEAIGAWLALVEQAATHDARLAREVAECARLIKGYGDTLKRGTGSYARIEAALIRPALEAARNARATPEAAERIAAAREAALADPEGDALERLLAPAAAQAAPARSA